MSFRHNTDEELMARLRDGERDALGELALRYQNDLFRFCAHYLKDFERAKELAQETFIRVYSARARFDATRKFRPWALCIARNLCLNELKRKKTVSIESLEDFLGPARAESGDWRQIDVGPREALMASERRRLLRRWLSELDEDSREIVRLRFFEKLPARDIAEVIGGTEGAVRTRLHRILKSLQAKYRERRDDLW